MTVAKSKQRCAFLLVYLFSVVKRKKKKVCFFPHKVSLCDFFGAQHMVSSPISTYCRVLILRAPNDSVSMYVNSSRYEIIYYPGCTQLLIYSLFWQGSFSLCSGESRNCAKAFEAKKENRQKSAPFLCQRAKVNKQTFS